MARVKVLYCLLLVVCLGTIKIEGKAVVDYKNDDLAKIKYFKANESYRNEYNS